MTQNQLASNYYDITIKDRAGHMAINTVPIIDKRFWVWIPVLSVTNSTKQNKQFVFHLFCHIYIYLSGDGGLETSVHNVSDMTSLRLFHAINYSDVT